MEKEKKKYIPNTIGGWHRLLTYLADLAMFLIISITLFSLVSSPVSKAITPYKQYSQDTQLAYDNCMNFVLGSKLIEMDDEGNEISAITTLENDLIRFVNNETEPKNGVYPEIFAYFYLHYLPNNMTFDETKTYDIKYLNTYVFRVNDESSVFEKDSGDDTKLAVLKDYAKQNLKAYLIDKDITNQSQTIYDNAMNLYKENWTAATNLIAQSKEFQALSEKYSKSNNKVLYIYSITSMITFVICFFLYYLLVPALFGKGQTFAKKILHQRVSYEDGTPIKFKTLLVRSILIFIFSLLFYMVLPIFEVGANVINLPLFMVGDYVIYALSPCTITLLCSVVSYFICNNSLNHQSLHDLVLRTVVLKDNPDYVEPVGEEKQEEENTEF